MPMIIFIFINRKKTSLELKHVQIPDSRSGYESVNIFSPLVT